MRRTKRLVSVRSRVAALMLLCWFIPLILLAGVNQYYLRGDRLTGRISREVEQLKFSDEIVTQQLEKVVNASLEASYDHTLLSLYDRFQAGTLSQHRLITDSGGFLRDCYSLDKVLDMAVLWYHQDPDRLYASTYNSSTGTTYADVLQCWVSDYGPIAARAETLGTRAVFLLCEDRLYFVRNLCTDAYEPVATLALRVNRDACFQVYSTFSAETSVTLKLAGNTLQVAGKAVTPEETGLTEMGGRAGYIWEDGVLRLYHSKRMGDYAFTALLRIENDAAFAPFRGYHTILAGMLLLLAPLLALLAWVFHRCVTRPIQMMMKGAKEIEEGHLGYQLTDEPRSTEFRYLQDSFNTMSGRLEYQFQHIYEEELALRDARIKALQSHINPHFMNNTLEIINWEARLSGNEKVSHMIEALATLMNAGIDRKMMPEIPLSEEMQYVNAYLYITSQRLGDRLTILNEFPEEIMDCMVPRLILQPVIENAIEHGVVRNGRGTVLLYGYREGKHLYLEITNESVLTPADEEKIHRLLDPGYDTSREPSLNLGIANVNQRLRILYGEDSGLSVRQSDPRHVTSRLTICLADKTSGEADDRENGNPRHAAPLCE